MTIGTLSYELTGGSCGSCGKLNPEQAFCKGLLAKAMLQ